VAVIGDGGGVARWWGGSVVHEVNLYLIRSTEDGHDAQQADLNPRRWNAVVVIVAREAVLGDLLEN